MGWGTVADTGLSKATMDDGVYEVAITAWKGRDYEKGDQNGVLLDLTLEIVGVRAPLDEAKYLGKEPFKETWWLTRTPAKKIFVDELRAIGFDVGSWSDNEGDPLWKGEMLPLAVKYARLKRLTLLLKKSTDQNKYHNLRFVGRVEDGSDAAKTIPNEALLAEKDTPESADEIF